MQVFQLFRSVGYIFLWLLFLVNTAIAQEHGLTHFDDKKALVTMRMIGHEVLNLVGDSTSLILPVSRIRANEVFTSYKIEFDNDITFDPEQLALVVIPLMEKSGLSPHYIVETQDCETNDIVHSFQIGGINQNQVIPCKGRVVPKACYHIVVTLYTQLADNDEKSEADSKTDNASQFPSILLLMPLLFLIVIMWVFIKRKQQDESDPFTLMIGNYRFNTRERILSFNDREIELSQKEADLLQLLNLSSNQTVSREVLLEKVWGDDGDYIGRTLDVFISKLRKKLDVDNSLKIENIRGVGYKLIVSPVP
jgi:DNA-binding winged helix-turn-helix (wHTH) protein